MIWHGGVTGESAVYAMIYLSDLILFWARDV